MKINVRCVYNYRYSASANRSCSMSTLYCLSMMEKHSLPSVKMSCVLFNVKFNLFLFLWETIESKMSNIECKSLPTYLSSRNFISYETPVSSGPSTVGILGLGFLFFISLSAGWRSKSTSKRSSMKTLFEGTFYISFRNPFMLLNLLLSNFPPF